MMAEDPEHSAEAARQLRALTMENRDNDKFREILGANKCLRVGILHLLSVGSDAARYWCCHCIVSLSHKHAGNQSVLANHPGMMNAILDVLLQGSPLSRGAACSALVESTFRNADNALLVAKTPGMMQGVVSVMQSSIGDVKDDAAGVLRNCSNYSQEAAEVIVSTPGVLDALIEMCKGQHNSDRFTAMGTIQNLTRCSSVVEMLRKTRVVTDALLPSLHASGSGEEHDVMRAEALMAITNLSSNEQLQVLVADADVVAVIVQMLRCAVKGQAWRDVAWYDAEECLRPLAQLTNNPENRNTLQSAAIVPVLADLLCHWLCSEAESMPKCVHDEARRQSSAMTSATFGCCGLRGFMGFEAASKAESTRKVALLGESVCMDADRLLHTLAVWETVSAQKMGGINFLGHASRFVSKECDLAVLALVNLAKDRQCETQMLEIGIPRVLRAVGVATEEMEVPESQFCTADMSVLERRHLAVSMGHHSRLGSQCYLMMLDAPILWLIMQEASTVSAAADSLADALDWETNSERVSGQAAQGVPERVPIARLQSNPGKSTTRWPRGWRGRTSGPAAMNVERAGGKNLGFGGETDHV
eukprot:CAMPEP_0181315946 /NCGR_PEP_ID=MMETSP1101-20121128/15638_1 /TAXON_ID=46948 /ORGANISM="Rhodomonas abbreviata, Strain Caron Lab Isolate" /LENGTH=588 /DNA_ID=CAMNT_0023423171 /DNA_START=314 /DNA_END=2080 /DNA_ORIENTATION=-